jgi:phosphoenolpyruvate synthase/pyruvate phosphate dikinase
LTPLLVPSQDDDLPACSSVLPFRIDLVDGSYERPALQVIIPEDLRASCADALNKLSEGQVTDNSAALDAIKRVWASKYGERACRAAVFLNESVAAIHMSVVLQPLINASMAFVSHTRDPRQLQGTGMKGTRQAGMYVEAVSGLGESLVGNVSGQPLSFTVDSGTLIQSLQDAVRSGRVPAADLKCLSTTRETDAASIPQSASGNLREWLLKLPDSDFENAASCVTIETASSKLWMVVPGKQESVAAVLSNAVGGTPAVHYGMIARSASNMEDLEHYSGAGVFDSFPTEGSRYCVADGSGSWANGFVDLQRTTLLMALASLEVKACLDEGEMDVEGVLDAFGHVHVVQARPQV